MVCRRRAAVDARVGQVGDMMWADFAGADYAHTLTDDQAAFVARAYAIVSLEKCFAMDAYNTTEAAVVATAARLKAANPTVKVLMYFSVTGDYSDCYASGPLFEAHPEWWLRDDAGAPYGSPGRRSHDMTQAAVRDYWTGAIANCSALGPPGLLDGVFADGASGANYSNMGPARQAAVVAGMHTMLNDTASALRDPGFMGAGARLIGNGLELYPRDPPDHGAGVLPFMDGVVWEHWLAFKMLDAVNGSLVPALFDEAVGLLANATAGGKVVLVKGWPGPATTPITPLGPAWPGGDQPGDYAGRAAAAAAWLTPSLAAFLLVVEPNVYFSLQHVVHRA